MAERVSYKVLFEKVGDGFGKPGVTWKYFATACDAVAHADKVGDRFRGFEVVTRRDVTREQMLEESWREL